MKRYICIHGHFYQPPRENPWLEAIELQDSAHPYHDWNEKVAVECYAPNAISRILDDQGWIIQMINNYAKISFDFGPTLLIWLEKHVPYVYSAVLQADRESQKRFSGHGSALAQAYNHIILPLAHRRDKHTQIQWGIKDFMHRFARIPEGMWLPETAVDIETLDVMAELGLRFTILAPHQARRVRPLRDKGWQEVSGSTIDTRMPYLYNLPSGRCINLFFYNGPISRAVAFEKLLNSGESFAQRLLKEFSEADEHPQMVHIATDGESYGHHHRFGDMALAYALHYIESQNNVELTNYGEYLEQHPPSHEVEIIENTSWSCAHGVERWQSDCGCSTKKHPDWNQAWRTPLKGAFDWLRKKITPPYEERARLLLKDPWEARNDYIRIILDRSPANLKSFFSQHATRELSRDEEVIILKLLELQRHMMLIYTSCGWFFDDISGIETVQILQYAGRAIQLAQEIFGKDLFESDFVKILASSKSNIPEYGDGQFLYEKYVDSTKLDLERVCSHYAISSLFREYDKQSSIYAYRLDREDNQEFEAGRAKLIIGKTRIASKITLEAAFLGYGVLHLGDHNINCGVKSFILKDYEIMCREVSKAFANADFPQTIRVMDKHFGNVAYSLKSLFRDERRRIITQILESTLAEVESHFLELYDQHAPLMRFLKDSGIPPPKMLYMSAEFVLNASLRRAFEKSEIDAEDIKSLLEEAQFEGVALDSSSLEYTLRKALDHMADLLLTKPDNLEILKRVNANLDLMDILPFTLNLWRIQNICYDILRSAYPKMKIKSEQGKAGALEWIDHFHILSNRVLVKIP
jgi:alpha-amylase/alpha-mannosidase (GH57 family)